MAASANSAQASATTFVNPPPVITAQPGSQTVLVVNNSAAASPCHAIGFASAHFQWRVQRRPDFRPRTPQLHLLIRAQYSDAGHLFRDGDRNSYGSALSSNAQRWGRADHPPHPADEHLEHSSRLTDLCDLQQHRARHLHQSRSPATCYSSAVRRSFPATSGVFILDANTGIAGRHHEPDRR